MLSNTDFCTPSKCSSHTHIVKVSATPIPREYVMKALTCLCERIDDEEGKARQEDQEDKVDQEVPKVDVAGKCTPLVVQQAGHKWMLQQVNPLTLHLGRKAGGGGTQVGGRTQEGGRQGWREVGRKRRERNLCLS